MSDIKVQVRVPVLKKDSKLFASYVRGLLEVVVTVNRLALQSDQAIPALYRSGVRFQREPNGVETFADIYTTWAKRHGDCAHLCCWRVAELLEQGENARLRITWATVRPGALHYRPGSRLFHVQVRRGNGDVEDPSKLLGMTGQG